MSMGQLYASSNNNSRSQNDENLSTPNGKYYQRQNGLKSIKGSAIKRGTRVLGSTSPTRLNTLHGYSSQKVNKPQSSFNKPAFNQQQKQPCMKRQASMSSLSLSQPRLKKANSLAMLNHTLSRIGSTETNEKMSFNKSSLNIGKLGYINNDSNTLHNSLLDFNFTKIDKLNDDSISKLNNHGINYNGGNSQRNKTLINNNNPVFQRQRSFDISSTLFRTGSVSNTDNFFGSVSSSNSPTKGTILSQNNDEARKDESLGLVPDRFIPASTNEKINSSLASIFVSSRSNNTPATNIITALNQNNNNNNNTTSHMNRNNSEDSEDDMNQTELSLSLLDSPPPPANASPETHLKSLNKKIFQKTVANVCGINENERILQYLPKAPLPSLKRSQSYSLENNRKRYTYDYYSSIREEDSYLGLSNSEYIKISGGSNMNLGNNFMKSDFIDRNKLNFQIRKVNQSPERILDCPDFLDDFYLNLISWNKRNILAIALNQSVYLWNGDSGDVSQLLNYDGKPMMKVTSLTWSDDDFHLSIGFELGFLEVWDTETLKKIRKMHGLENSRIGVQSWLCNLIATGNKDGMIKINDVRIKDHVIQSWDDHHNQLEVCGLTYRADGLQLASGGNDNSMIIWDTRTSQPQYIKRQHQAAVKALSWNPDVPTLLASGGGLNDQKIHFWNTNVGNRINTIDTGTQISSLHWGQSLNNKREIVVTGGEPRNAISIYNYEMRLKVAEIVNAHDSKIISSQLSPDGTTLVTIGGDENLKFFKIFEPKKSKYSGFNSQDEFVDDDNFDGSKTHDGKLKSPHKSITIR